MKGEFLLEIGTEEIPASFIPSATDSFCELFNKTLENSRITYDGIEWYATPRRLIFRALNLAPVQASVDVEKIGPARSAAFDEHGNPTKAAIGFAKSQGVEVADLVVIKTPKGEQVAIRKTEKGIPTKDVLAEVLPGLLEKISFPKTMRWMDLDARFARPVHWIVALLDGEVIPFTFGAIGSGNLTRGHRFTHPGSFPVSGFEELRNSLEYHGVFIDPNARRSEIDRRVKELAASAGLNVFEEPDLLDEATYLVESPYPVMGEFSADFLELPASILITCMKKHQRYFSVQDKAGRITNRFIAVNNTPVRNPEFSVRGHQRVLKARLEDARFYFKEDRKLPLFDRLEALKGVVFHSKLGTAYEKVQRFTAIAVMLAERFAPDKVEEVKRASLLCKCDLETGIVYEFPELQGIIGSYYAKMDGEAEEVSTAVREHYLPGYAGDSLPNGIIGNMVSIADRIDTVAGCFSVGLIPTGAADPYALRRNALGIIQILIGMDKPLNLLWLIKQSVDLIGSKRTRQAADAEADILEFFRTRFVNFHTSRDFSLDVVEAAVRARFDDVVDARRRVEALNDWRTRPDFEAIIVGFKRVMNILKNTEPSTFSPDLFQEQEEKQLFSAFQDVKGKAVPLIEAGDYGKALEIIADLKTPIDNLFDKVMVMVEDEKLRNNRLGLLRAIAEFFGRIADFSFIGSTAQGR